MLRCYLLFIGGTTLAVIVTAACGEMLERLYPGGGVMIFAAYFFIHVVALSGAWVVAIRYS